MDGSRRYPGGARAPRVRLAVKARDRIERSGLGVPIDLVYLDLGGISFETVRSDPALTAAVPSRAIPCSAAPQQRHKIVQNRLALVGEESVSGVTAEPPPGQTGTPTHAHLHHRQRRNHAVPQGAGDTQ